MTLTIHPTTKVVQLVTASGSVPARLWEGTTDTGLPVHCYVTRVAALEDAGAEAHAQLARELLEQRKPTPAVEAIPGRLIL